MAIIALWAHVWAFNIFPLTNSSIHFLKMIKSLFARTDKVLFEELKSISEEVKWKKKKKKQTNATVDNCSII